MEAINFKDGLIDVVTVDNESGEVLMLAHMDKEAFRETLKTGFAHYLSRSRNELWKKGQTSGNTQKVKEIRLDCDGDALLLKVEQKGGACHKGYYSCFYRKYRDGSFVKDKEKIFDPSEVYETES